MNEKELIKAALVEDLAGGADITSEATISADASDNRLYLLPPKSKSHR